MLNATFTDHIRQMCPQHGIKHKAAISDCKHCLRTVIAALCLFRFVGTLTKMAPDLSWQ